MILSVLATALHMSVPLAEVAAGLLLGSRLPGADRTDSPKFYLNRFWHLMDEVLNTILFVMIGLQIVVLPFLTNYLLVGLLAVVLIVIARGLSIFLPSLLRFQPIQLKSGNLRILTWAGLRGGISVALALSLPDSAHRELILSSCYCIVIFSIIGQGLTLNKLVNAVVRKEAANPVA